MKTDNVIVETRDLVKTYGDGVAVKALDGVNMKVHRGEMVTVEVPANVRPLGELLT